MRELLFLITLALGTAIGFAGCGDDCDDETETVAEMPADAGGEVEAAADVGSEMESDAEEAAGGAGGEAVEEEVEAAGGTGGEAVEETEEAAGGSGGSDAGSEEAAGGSAGEAVEEETGDRHEGELAEGAAGGDDAEREGAFFVGHGLADRAEHHREAGAAEPDADQELAKQDCLAGEREPHDQHAEGVDQAADGADVAGAESVGEGAEEGGRGAPGEILDRNGEREELAPGAELLADRRQEETEALPETHVDGDDRRSQSVLWVVHAFSYPGIAYLV